MKAKVLKRFKDKHTGEVYRPGAIITVTKKRFAEILQTAKLVEEYTEEETEETTEEETEEETEETTEE